MERVTSVAPVNIAVIKYWGKRDEDRVLPLNDSISVTLSPQHLATKTTVAASPNFAEHKLWLNGKETPLAKRVHNCFSEICNRLSNSEVQRWNKSRLQICSFNNFPTGAGLASSAAGYAALVTALVKLFDVQGDPTAIARVGSGSACRSLHGGFVRWFAGSLEDGSDSIAAPIAPHTHWPELRVFILVVSDATKHTASTFGMKHSSSTSTLLSHRVETVLPRRLQEMQRAILYKDFPRFAELTMQDSNQFHAVCLDSYPPIIYLNDVSRTVIDFVHKYNDTREKIEVAYTFDAGPNPVLFLLEDSIPVFFATLMTYFPTTQEFRNYFKGKAVPPCPASALPVDLNTPILNDAFKYIIYTEVGEGSSSDSEDHLLDENGNPMEFNNK